MKKKSAATILKPAPPVRCSQFFTSRSLPILSNSYLFLQPPPPPPSPVQQSPSNQTPSATGSHHVEEEEQPAALAIPIRFPLIQELRSAISI